MTAATVPPVAATALDLELTVARTLGEVEALRPAWERLQGGSLATDPAFFLAVVRNHPEVIRPHLVAVSRGGVVVGLVTGRLHATRVTQRVGYAKVYSPRVGSLNVPYGGFLGELSPAVLDLALGSLRRSLRKGEAEALLFRHVPVESPVCDAVASSAGIRRPQDAVAAEHWLLDLDGPLEHVLQRRSAKTRENVRRSVRKVAQELGDGARVERYTSAARLDELFDAVETIAGRSYQRAAGSAYAGDELQRALARAGVEQGWFRGYVLYAGERPCAFWTGFAYKGTFGWGGATGYDPEFRSLNPGTYLFTRMLDDLCRDPAVESFDFGHGEAEYKRYFGDRNILEQDLRIFGTSLRALRIRSLTSVVRGTDRVARRVASVGSVDALARRTWRRRLERRGTA